MVSDVALRAAENAMNFLEAGNIEAWAPHAREVRTNKNGSHLTERSSS
jgi:hypothetical protein